MKTKTGRGNVKNTGITVPMTMEERQIIEIEARRRDRTCASLMRSATFAYLRAENVREREFVAA
jgi:hypothetical protein